VSLQQSIPKLLDDGLQLLFDPVLDSVRVGSRDSVAFAHFFDGSLIQCQIDEHQAVFGRLFQALQSGDNQLPLPFSCTPTFPGSWTSRNPRLRKRIPSNYCR